MNGEFPDNGRGFSWKGKTLLSAVDPGGRARRAAEAVPVRERTLYLCPSPLYGYGLDRLLERIAAVPNCAVLCIEAEPELFALAQEHINAAPLQGSQIVRLTNHCDAEALCVLLRKEWGPRFFRRVEMVRLNGGWQLHHALYDMMAEALRREIALDWGNAMTLTKLGRRYIRNALRNLPLLPRCRSLQELDFADAPTLVLGAGPSLDHALDGLRSRFGELLELPQKRSFKIICVDTCLTALQERGIVPDLAVILECQHWNLDDFAGLSGWNVPAAVDLSALPRSASVLGGSVYLFFTPWTSLTIFERLQAADLLPPRLPPLGSVGLSAAAIACRLTRGAIITAGLDFSFTPDSYHARSTPGHKKKLRRQNRFTRILNAEAAFGGTASSAVSKTGGAVLSTPAMRGYRDLFEREFGGGAYDGRFYDIAGDGLPLGVKTLSLEDALDVLDGRRGRERDSHGGTGGTGHTENAEDTEILKFHLPPCPLSCPQDSSPPCLREKSLKDFISNERERLIILRDMLTGAAPMDADTLVALIEECDYLWAHFPDYAGTDRRPDTAALSGAAGLSFLNRLRVEIDPFLQLWDLVSTI